MTAIATFFGCAMLALAFLLPGHYAPWLSFQQDAMAGGGGALLALAASTAAVQRGLTVRWPLLAWAALAACVVPLVQLALGQIHYLSVGLGSAAYLAGLALAIVTGATLARDPQHGAAFVDALTAALTFGALASAGMALAQWLQLGVDGLIDASRPGSRVWANFGQPNHLALLQALGIASLLRWYETSRIGGATLALGAAVMGIVLVTTGSRAGWLFVGLTAAWVLWCKRHTELRLGRVPVAVALAGFAAVVMALPQINDALLLTVTADTTPRTEAGTRPLHWQAMWAAAWLSPWVGWGWQQVQRAQQAAALDFPYTGEMLANSHNLLLDLMVWNGIALGVAMFALLAWWLISRARRCADASQCMLWALVALPLLHCLVEFPLDYLFFLLPVGLLMGSLDALQGSAPAWRWGRVALPALTLPLAALLSLGVVEYAKVDAATRTLRFVVLGIGVDKVPNAPEPEVLLFDYYGDLHRFLLSPLRDDMKPQELAEAARVVERFAMPAAFFRLAALRGLHGDPSGAARNLALLCWLHQRHYCDNGRTEWAALQQRYPQLAPIAFPPTPPLPALK